MVGATVGNDSVFKADFGDRKLNEHILSIILWHGGDGVMQITDLEECEIAFHIYQLNEEVGQEELEEEDGGLAAAQNWLLPSTHFNGLWENLVYDGSIKTQVSLRLLTRFEIEELSCIFRQASYKVLKSLKKF